MTSTPPPPPPPPHEYQTAQPPLSPADEKLWSTLTHVGALLFGWLVPLITYLLFKDRGPFVRAHTATALNFQLTMVIVYIAGFVLSFVLIGFFVLIAAGIVVLVFSILAAVAANRGEFYTYPLSIPFVK
jgi:uncharacterized Tic20 family protein